MTIGAIELLLAFAILFGVFSFGVLLSDIPERADADEELAWIDEQIRQTEFGDIRSVANPEMQAQRRAYLDRLYRVRERLVGGNRG